MSIHQQVNHNTVDPSQLPDYRTGENAMNKVSRLLWNVDNRESYVTFHDYWSNSTPRTGVRVHRVRHMNSPQVQAIMPKVHKLLASYEGMYKTYLWGRYWMQGDTGYDVHTGQAMCVVLYYRSWQPGEPRRTTACDPGHELTLVPGQRVMYHYTDLVRGEGGTGFGSVKVSRPATIRKRVTHNQFHPYYLLKFDTPFNENNDYSPAGRPERLTLLED